MIRRPAAPAAAAPTPAGMDLRTRHASLSLPGPRAANADAEDALFTEGFALVVVADGVGDDPRPARAAVAALTEEMQRAADSGGRQHSEVIGALRAGLRRADALVRAANGCSTLCAALLVGDTLRVAWVGDSRAYLVRDGSTDLLTRDHNEAAAGGTGSPSRLTRALGSGMDDWEEREERLSGGELLVLATDGLRPAYGLLERSQWLRQALLQGDSLAGRLRLLSRLAPLEDNLTLSALDLASERHPGPFWLRLAGPCLAMWEGRRRATPALCAAAGVAALLLGAWKPERAARPAPCPAPAAVSSAARSGTAALPPNPPAKPAGGGTLLLPAPRSVSAPPKPPAKPSQVVRPAPAAHAAHQVRAGVRSRRHGLRQHGARR